jgi:hypothetical protein
MTNLTTSKNDRIAHCQSLIRGLRTKFPKQTLMINGKARPTEAVVKMLESYLIALAAIDEAYRAWRIATATASRIYFGQIHQLLQHIRAFLEMQYGRDGVELRGFGYKPRKRPYRSTQAKVNAAEKARATRKARGTKGKRQRARIRGVVPATR